MERVREPVEERRDIFLVSRSAAGQSITTPAAFAIIQNGEHFLNETCPAVGRSVRQIFDGSGCQVSPTRFVNSGMSAKPLSPRASAAAIGVDLQIAGAIGHDHPFPGKRG